MIKIIKQGNPPTTHKFEITCAKCNTVFQCGETDCSHVPGAQGFWAYAIKCPTCHTVCTDRQGDPCDWKWIMN